MKNALKLILLIVIAVASSMTGLGVNIFGVSICEKSEIANLQGIMVNPDSDMLVVILKPTSLVQADLTYTVDLYEKGTRRDSATVVWSRIQANVQETQSVSFPISSEEADEYSMVTQSQLRKIFSVKVYE